MNRVDSISQFTTSGRAPIPSKAACARAAFGAGAPPVELVLFRVLQESLTNIYRHSKSTRAKVQLRVLESEAVLKIRDFGVGVPQHILRRFENQGTSGVGLAGMRGRISELGGDFQVESDSEGTVIVASVPFPFVSRDESPVQSRSV